VYCRYAEHDLREAPDSRGTTSAIIVFTASTRLLPDRPALERRKAVQQLSSAILCDFSFNDGAQDHP
jgi:hypothetical protein